jgi:hypothetical protein
MIDGFDGLRVPGRIGDAAIRGLPPANLTAAV